VCVADPDTSCSKARRHGCGIESQPSSDLGKRASGLVEVTSLIDVPLRHVVRAYGHVVTVENRGHRRAMQLEFSGNGADRLALLIHLNDPRLTRMVEVTLLLEPGSKWDRLGFVAIQ